MFDFFNLACEAVVVYVHSLEGLSELRQLPQVVRVIGLPREKMYERKCLRRDIISV